MTILLLGAQGQLGWELGASLSTLGQVFHFSRKEADLTQLDSIKDLLHKIKPTVIVNAAAHTKVDEAEKEEALTTLINAQAPEFLAQWAKENEAWLVHYSTDYVFDGKKETPYTEEDTPGPLNVYGKSKLQGDQAIINSGCRHLIFRTSWVFSSQGKNFPRTILELARKEQSLKIVDDQFGSPTSVELLSSATALALCLALRSDKDLSGLYNMTAAGSVSWRQYAIYVVEKATKMGWSLLASAKTIDGRSSQESGRPAKRPSNSRLNCDKFIKTFGLTPAPWQYYVDRLLWSWIQTPGFHFKSQQRIIGRKFIHKKHYAPC